MVMKESDDCSPKPLFPKKTILHYETVSSNPIPAKSDSLLGKPTSNVTTAVLALNKTSPETSPVKAEKESSPTRKVVTTMNMAQKLEVVRPNVGQVPVKSTSSSVIKPILNRSQSRGNIFKWFSKKTDQAVDKTECIDMSRRMKKMSWGQKSPSSSAGNGGVRAVRFFIFKCLLFGIKAGIASGLCCYTAEEGLWGTPEETKLFYSNLMQLAVNGAELPTKETLLNIVNDFKDGTQP